MVILTDDQLEKKNTKNLLFIKRKLTPQVARFGYCEGCREHCGLVETTPTQEQYQTEQTDYLNRIKAILKTREHVEKDKSHDRK